MKSPPNFSDQNNVMGTGASDVERRVEKIDKKLTRGNRESHKLTKLYKKYKKFKKMCWQNMTSCVNIENVSSNRQK